MNHRRRSNEIVSNLLRRPGKVEALRWLREATPRHRGVGELTNAESVLLVRNLYAWGATEVVAVDIARNGNFESTDTLIAFLPGDPSMRKTIFEWDNRRIILMGFDPDDDVGQRHLLIWFD